MTMPLPGVVGQSPGTGFQPAMPPPQLMHSVLPAAAQMASLLPSSAANAVEQPLATQPPLLESLGHQQNSVTSRGLEEQQIPMQKLTQPCDSRVMVLKNMVDADEVDDELEGEVSEECGKYGTVQRVIIHNERRANDEDTWASSVDTVIVVKIFVEFSNQKDVESAVTALDGRYFAGRSIVASAYDQERYEKGDLSG
jgi:poly(U)-binding-splicing factor PUF60